MLILMVREVLESERERERERETVSIFALTHTVYNTTHTLYTIQYTIYFTLEEREREREIIYRRYESVFQC